MDALALTFTSLIICLAVVWMIPDGKKKIQADEQPKHNGIIARFKRMADYNKMIVDLPDSPEPMLRNNIQIEISGMPYIDKSSDVGSYASDVAMRMVLKLVQTGSTLVLSDIQQHTKFFGLKAEVAINGHNIGEYMTANFVTPPMPKPVLMPMVQPVQPVQNLPERVNNFDRYDRRLN